MVRARIHRTSKPLFVVRLLACSLFALPAVAQADEPAVDGHALGITESMLNYCTRIDATSAARFQQKIKLLVRGASEATVAGIRKTDEYRVAYDSVTDFTSKIADRNAKRTCNGSLTRNK
jgi:hypothetical protein